MDSILQDKKECYICRRYGISTMRMLEKHHVFGGVGRRAISERYGLTVWLCHIHHNEPPLGVHFNAGERQRLQADARHAFERLHGIGSFDTIFDGKILDETKGGEE